MTYKTHPPRPRPKPQPRPRNFRPARARHIPGVMNRTEACYARERLAILELDGKIQGWLFEPMKLRLGDKCFYTPDFMVVNAEGEIEFHEVKGHWEDDARVKIKAAASRFPWFLFIAIKVCKAGFEFETIRAHHSEVA